ncbi:MAG TPA: hypothetical protein VNU46_04480 [Gemmatimonadaceae bacterium]|jgi:hypothetical protein|nr:hypothetical protein [Gemmatimonadaceae bacterium]
MRRCSRHGIGSWIAALIICHGALEAQGVPAAPQHRDQAQRDVRLAMRALVVDHDTSATHRYLLSALTSDSTYNVSRFDLGVLAETAEDWSSAKGWFTRFLSWDSTSSDAQAARGELRTVDARIHADSSPREALAARYQSTIELGRRMLALGMANDALVVAARARSLDSTRWEAYALAAAAAAQRNDPQLARALADSAATRAPPPLQKVLRSISN